MAHPRSAHSEQLSWDAYLGCPQSLTLLPNAKLPNGPPDAPRRALFRRRDWNARRAAPRAEARPSLRGRGSSRCCCCFLDVVRAVGSPRAAPRALRGLHPVLSLSAALGRSHLLCEGPSPRPACHGRKVAQEADSASGVRQAHSGGRALSPARRSVVFNYENTRMRHDGISSEGS